MKKLMIAVAAAAMIGSAFAEAQVIVWNLNLKTTTCKQGKVAKNTWWINGLDMEKGDQVVYRTTSTVKLTGVTWGCYCGQSLAGQWNARDIIINKAGDTITVWDGITFWNPKEDAFLGGVYDGSVFDWEAEGRFVNRMGKNADEVEMCFDLVPSDTALDDEWGFTLAGFGKVKDVSKYDKDLDEVVWCDSYLNSANGGVVGFTSPDAGTYTCTYCDQYGVDCDIYDFCEDCEAPWESNDAVTVAYGTWTAKYNSAASKKLRTKLYITESYTGFSKLVKAALVYAGE
jgi:hypothetical protein